MSKKSKILVLVQFACFAYFLSNSNLLASKFLIGVQLIGFILAIWGVIVMKIGNFNVQPEVKQGAKLITNGPYRLIRNPMYTGLLIFFIASLISTFSFFSLGILIILIVVFITKIRMEEIFLFQNFGEKYLSYKKKTYRLIPFIY